MDDKPSEELPPFRWNRPALAMTALTGVMLVVPLAGVMYFLSGYLAAPRPAEPPPIPVVSTRPLASALETTAEAQLGGDHVKLDAESELALRLPADQIAVRMTRIAEQARDAGGSALEMPAENPPARRLIISVPDSRRDLLRRAISGEKIDFSAIPAGGRSEILNVTLTPR